MKRNPGPTLSKLIKLQIAIALGFLPGGVMGIMYFVSDSFVPIWHRIVPWFLLSEFALLAASLAVSISIMRQSSKEQTNSNQ